MMCSEFAPETLDLYFYGECDAGLQHSIAAHLPGCSSCRSYLAELSTIRDVLATRDDAAVLEAIDWSGFMSSLDARLEGVTPATVLCAGNVSMLRWRGHIPEVQPLAVEASGWRARWSAAGELAAAAAVLLLILGAIGGIGWQLKRAALAAADAPSVKAENGLALDSVASRHFERSKLVVLGLLSKDPDDPRSDWSYERQLAATLWPDTRAYRNAAVRQGMPGLAKALGDLEVVLLQTAFSDNPDAGTLGGLQRLIRARDLRLTMETLERRSSVEGELRPVAARTAGGL